MAEGAAPGRWERCLYTLAGVGKTRETAGLKTCSGRFMAMLPTATGISHSQRLRIADFFARPPLPSLEAAGPVPIWVFAAGATVSACAGPACGMIGKIGPAPLF